MLHYKVWSIILNYQLGWLHVRKLELGVKRFSCSLVDGQQGTVWEFRFGNCKLLELDLPELVGKHPVMLWDGC